MSETVHHISPEDLPPDTEFKQRQFLIFDDKGEVIAGAEIDKYSRPLPLYQVTDLWSERPGQRLASTVMDEVEAFLKKTKKPGVLVDAIVEGSPAEGMYTRRGWEYVPDQHGLMVFNWPQKAPLSIMAGYAMRYTPIYEREAFVRDHPIDHNYEEYERR
jgi:hypothetical protein